MTIPAGIEDLAYSSVLFNRLADTYDATRGLLSEKVTEQITDCILRIVHAKPDTRFLEPGVGTGRIAVPFVLRGYPYTGVDISKNMIDAFRRKLREAPNRLALIQADITSLPFKDASFDVVLTAAVLYLIPNWRQTLAEIQRVLRPTGHYLYCYEDTQGNAVAMDFDRQWQSILTRNGFQQVWHSNTTDETCLQVLRDQGVMLKRVTAAEWWTECRIDEYLTTYAAKVRPLYPHISNDIFSAAIRDFEAWAKEHYESDDILSYRFKFEIQIARYQAVA
jgi:ubiquinone/menaquinone biosynthesis C-methylase UbiE